MTLDKNCIVTYTGRTINPLNPRPEDISIVDIAHSLSNQCRFTGHTREFYSVAQHSVLVAELVPEQDRLWGLLHDGTEAYLADLAKPIKRNISDLAEAYIVAERKLMHTIALAFDLPMEGFAYDKHGLPASVKEADVAILQYEMRWLMPELLHEDTPFEEDALIPWTPQNAKTNFLIRFAELTDNDFQID